MDQQYKRYLVFVFDEFYPSGGLCDVEYQADTIEEVRNLKNEPGFYMSDGLQVLDMAERRMLTEEEHGLPIY